MDAQGDARDRTLCRRARARLLAGERPDAVFTAVAKDTTDYRAAAIAVCAAAGVPRAQAEQRWADTGKQAASLIRPGEEAALGDILELVGFFDVHPELDEREQRARHQLVQVMNALTVWPSGYAHSLSRKLQSGRLTEAFISLTEYGARRTRPTPAAYWTQLLAAADHIIASDNARFESCVTLCRRQLDQAETPTSQ